MILYERKGLAWFLCKLLGHRWREWTLRDERYRVVGFESFCPRCKSVRNDFS
jgi:hypothetical protein